MERLGERGADVTTYQEYAEEMDAFECPNPECGVVGDCGHGEDHGWCKSCWCTFPWPYEGEAVTPLLSPNP